MVIADLSSKLVFLDTTPLIYYIEGGSAFQPVLQRLFSSSDNANLFLQTSTITLLEVLVKPLKDGRRDLVEQYKEILLNAPGMTVRAVDSNVAETAAGLRV
jgi:predicted nucleic acid-binding protein